MPHGDGSDAALARSWQAGDVRAFDEAYRRFAPALFGTAVGLVGDRSAAGDVVHDTFLRAATRIGGLRDPARLRAWLFAILRNEATSVHRGRSRLGGGLDDGPAPVSEWLADSSPAPDVELSRRELADLLWSAADGLQPRDREVLELHLRGGLEAGDLGLAMGVTAGHAAVLLSRMRDRLERCLGALLIARSGRPGCAELDRVLSGWDGRFSLEVRGRVTRHVEGCRACGQRRGALVSLEHLAPVLVPPMVVLPEELHARLVADLAGLPSSAGALDARGTEWAWREDGFPWPGEDGFPWPAEDGEAALLGSIVDDVPRRRPAGPPARRAALAAIVVLLLVGAGVMTAVVRGRPPASEVTTVAEPVIATEPGSAPAPGSSASTGAPTGAPTGGPTAGLSIPGVPASLDPAGSVAPGPATS
ncbi:MAG: sigma-70 family RNA polymerase sigma factor, partial [Kineosporiaceae bacterium]